MNKTKIDWATMSWNPLTGCRHGCPYCYARRTAHRFDKGLEDPAPLSGGLHVLEEKIKGTPYPYGFEPTLHLALLPHGENFWYGSTVANRDAAAMYPMPWANINTFWSMEPLLEPVAMGEAEGLPRWVILGAETGSRRDKVIPRREWVDQIAAFCAENEIPVFYKGNLREYFPDLPASMFPWEV